jgi:hypothetical protein
VLEEDTEAPAGQEQATTDNTEAGGHEQAEEATADAHVDAQAQLVPEQSSSRKAKATRTPAKAGAAGQKVVKSRKASAVRPALLAKKRKLHSQGQAKDVVLPAPKRGRSKSKRQPPGLPPV